MKLQKKFAIQVAEFMRLYLENQYFPLDDMEAHLISKVLAFGKHHGIVDSDFIGNYKTRDIKNFPATARLDLTDVEMEAIIDMMKEVTKDTSVEFEMDPSHKGLTYYLTKQVVK